MTYLKELSERLGTLLRPKKASEPNGAVRSEIHAVPVESPEPEATAAADSSSSPTAVGS